jgi:hypothetical protein
VPISRLGDGSPSSNYAVLPGARPDYDNGRIIDDTAAAASDYAVGRLS